jgi:hypothetical protein
LLDHFITITAELGLLDSAIIGIANSLQLNAATSEIFASYMLLTSSFSSVAQVILPGLPHIHLAFQMTFHFLQQHPGQHCEMVQLPENQGNQALENCVPLEPPLEPLQLFGNLNIAFDLQDYVMYIHC